MQIIPAIDILGGRVVRLLRGDYDAVTVYDEDPVAVARRWHEEGADLIHVVDLEAARSGTRDLAVLEALAAAGVVFQVGGGVRSAADARASLDAGAGRVVVGSALTAGERDAGAIVEAVGPGAVVAAVDIRDGRARGSGWLDEGSPMAAVAERVVRLGIPRALVTGIDRDGTMAGPDVGLLRRVARLAAGVGIIASGGVGSLEDLDELASMRPCPEGVIVGRALYEGRFTVARAKARVADGG